MSRALKPESELAIPRDRTHAQAKKICQRLAEKGWGLEELLYRWFTSVSWSEMTALIKKINKVIDNPRPERAPSKVKSKSSAIRKPVV
jgi:hypothetical protein